MAKNSVKTPTKLSLLCLLAMFLCSLSQAVADFQETTMTFYLQDWSAVPNGPKGIDYTVVPVTGIPGKVWGFNSFGSIYVGDDPLTEGRDKNSTPVGRMQGLFLASAMDGSIVQLSASLVFTNEEYDGSTMELQGASRYHDRVREVAVVGGTGKFRFATGYATYETVYYEASTSYCLIQCNVTVRHHVSSCFSKQ